ncbi:putative death-receptor fusion protein-domain-containing protein [Scheffersomyces coipomensis]|uniref:putative death-receptor fusion protein-domain-containing protein n=1 Tax=Scheffersomyces coipomensis TaxID=1788519 RepID=UPI00315C8F8F
MKPENESEEVILVDMGKINDLKKSLISLKPVLIEPTEINQDFQFLYHQLQIIHKDGGLNDGNLTLFNDTISICILRITQIIKLKTSFKFDQVNLDEIFDYILQYINNSSNPLFNSLQALFNKLIDFISISQGNSFPQILSHWVTIIFDKNTKENNQIIILNKNSYFILNIILKRLSNLKHIINDHGNFIYNAIDLLSLDTLANIIAKTIIMIFNDSYVKNEDATLFETWFPFISYGLNSSNKKVIQNIQTYVLPSLFKTSPQFLNLLIDHYLLLDGKTDIVISLLTIGQNLSLVDPLTFIEEKVLLGFLTHENPTYRINSLDILLGGNTSINSPPIPLKIFQIIKDNFLIDTFLNDEEIEIRNQFISTMNQFINLRFKNSISNLKKTYKKNEEDQEVNASIRAHEQFLDWLEHHLLSFLNITSSYSQLITSLKLIEIIAIRIPDITNLYKNSHFLKLLIHNLFNDYENVRQLSLSLLINKVHSEQLKQEFNELGFNNLALIEDVYPILHDLSGRKSEGGARFIEYIAQTKLIIFKDEAFVVSLIDKILDYMSRNSKTDDWSYSMHGFFKCLNLIILNWNQDFYLNNKDLVTRLYLTIYKISKGSWDYYVENILGNSNLNDIEEDEEDDSSDLSSSSGWKSIKESNLLLTNLSVNLKIATEIIPADHILDVLNLIKEQLEKINHRGTFSSIYPSFILICKSCFESDQYKHVPKDWLSNILTTIESENDKYISRRSGSIPYLVSGILIGNIMSGNSERLFIPTFDTLFAIAKRPYVHKHNEAYDIPQVHAFNCLKQMFQESPLSKECLKYIPAALRLSLEHFTSDNWSVRNCAVMLFSAIHHRLFGGNTKGASLYPADLFFKKFEGIDAVLENFLNIALESKQNDRYVPMLLLLTNLSFPTKVNDKTIKTIKSIIPSILENSAYKIREMAARSIANSFESSEIWQIFESSIKACQTKNKNHIHGLLLMVLENINNFKSDSLRDAVKRFMYIKHDFILGCKCYAITKVYADILISLFHDGCDSSLINVMGNYFIDEVTDESSNLKGGKDLATSSVATFLLQQYLIQDQMENFTDVVELGLSSSKSYGTQVTILQLLESKWDIVSKDASLLSRLSMVLWTIIDTTYSWPYVQVFALDIFKRLDITSERQFTVIKQISDQDPNENKRWKALESLGRSLKSGSHHSSLDFLAKCSDGPKEENPFQSRESALKSLVSFCSHGMIELEGFTRALFLIISKGLYDEDGDLRSISGALLSRLLKSDHPIASTNLSKLDFKRIIPHSEIKLFNELILKEILDNTMSFVDIANLQYESSTPKLFEIETHNLYKNEIQAIQGYSSSIIIGEGVEQGYQFGLLESKILSDILVLQKQSFLSKGTIIELVRNPTLNKSILITITIAEVWLSKYPNHTIQTELQSLKSNLQFYDYIFTDATNPKHLT